MSTFQDIDAFKSIEDLEKFALPENNARYITTLKTHMSLQSFAVSSTVGNLQFFNNTTLSTVNTASYPNNQVMTEVLGIKIVHNFQFAVTPVDVTNKANQFFDTFARFKYTTPGRDARLNKPVFELSGVNGYIGSDGTMANALLSNNYNNDGFFKLPQVPRTDSTGKTRTFSELIIGAKQNPSFTLDAGGGTWTLVAADATGSNATPTAPTVSGVTFAGPFFIAVLLQVREWSPINV